MKFWLTFIVSIILISAAITWMSQKGGQSYGSNFPGHSAPPAPSGKLKMPPPPPAKILWAHDDRNSKQDGHVIEVKAGDSYVGQKSSFALMFRNAGDGPMEIDLLGVSCGCAHDVAIGKSPKDMQPLIEKKGPVMHFLPKENGILRVSWTPEEKQVAGLPFKDLQITVSIGTNDQLYHTMRLELTTRIYPATETKP